MGHSSLAIIDRRRTSVVEFRKRVCFSFIAWACSMWSVVPGNPRRFFWRGLIAGVNRICDFHGNLSQGVEVENQDKSSRETDLAWASFV
jgi:hypothetical protein